jgi:hypothetical protein
MVDYFTQSCKEAKTAKGVMLSDSETSHNSKRSKREILPSQARDKFAYAPRLRFATGQAG